MHLDVETFKKSIRVGSWEQEIVNLNETILVFLEENKQLKIMAEEDLILFQDILTLINESVANQDGILLCDLVEYELVPFLNKCSDKKMV